MIEESKIKFLVDEVLPYLKESLPIEEKLSELYKQCLDKKVHSNIDYEKGVTKETSPEETLIWDILMDGHILNARVKRLEFYIKKIKKLERKMTRD